MIRFVLAVSAFFINIIRYLSGANFTLSGEALPKTPVLFLANHFTRFETFVIPYLLFKKFNHVSRSLADDTVFVGWLGKYMKMAGVISNKSEARDCIIVDDFLSAKADWVIYPEGHMVKNKQITFDDGEFCIHTTMRQGAIYTGAAVLALKTEILRRRIQKAKEDKNPQAVKRFCSQVGASPSLIKEDKPLHITPLSVTYYPIRPGKNRLLLFLDKRLNLRGTRFFEELEIEINLLFDANMHLHFSKPIMINTYVDSYMQTHEGSLDDESYVNALIDVTRKKLINDIMAKVYGNMQINFDHIFILSLVTMPTLKVCPSYLKTLIYKNARELRKVEGLNLHPELQNELFKLMLEKNYAPLASALHLAQTQKILFQDSDGEYLFDKSLLKKDYDFNKVRVKNTLQVILNEIKWQTTLVKTAQDNSLFSEQELRLDNFAHLKNRDIRYFEKEYENYHDNTPKEDDIGRPIIMVDAKNTNGIVFSHGYMAAPAEAKNLAHYLFEKGINVYIPRLRGHGTAPEALQLVKDGNWEDDFSRAFTAMRQVCEKVFIGGFSTGGLLALILASKYESSGVIAINSALKLRDLKVSYVVPTLNAFNEMIAHLHAKGINEWIENHSENPEVNYPKHPLTSVAQMEKVMTTAEKNLSNIHAPIMILQGDHDPVVNPQSAHLIYENVQSKFKKLILLPRERHIILKGEDAQEVYQSVYRFIQDVLKRA